MSGGFDSEALAGVPGVLAGVIAAGDLAGAVTLVWRRGEIVQLLCRGERDIARHLPMERNTIFHLASMTKPVTSLAALILIDEGKLALDDPIARWAPEFSDMRVLNTPEAPLEESAPALRAITVEDLLTQRAGLAYNFTCQGPISRAYDEALADVFDTEVTPDEWLRALGALPLVCAPGERFQYGHATDVLGFILGRIATGEAEGFRDFLIERVLAPLGMADTDFFVPPAKRDRSAVIYRLNEALTGLEPVSMRRYDRPPKFCGGGAGLYSTVDDFLKFARLLLGDGAVDGERLVSEETARAMRTNRLTEAQRQIPFMGIPFWAGQGFGLGVSVITDPDKQGWMGAGMEGAFGWPGAFGTWWQADPKAEMVLLYMVQNSLPLRPDAAAHLAAGQRMGSLVALPMFQKTVYGALTPQD